MQTFWDPVLVTKLSEVKKTCSIVAKGAGDNRLGNQVTALEDETRRKESSK